VAGPIPHEEAAFVLGILSLSTEIIFWSITAISLIATVVFWHKLHALNFRNVFMRVSVIIFVQVFAIASLGLTINRAGEFFDTWGDFFGTNKNLSKVAIAPANLSTLTAQDVLKAKRTPGGSLIFKKVILGAKSGVADYVYLVTSPRLSATLESQATPNVGTNYQVVELFPGYPGVPETWIGSLKGIESMERSEKAGLIPPTIAVIPAINVVRGLDTECLNIPGTSQVETWLTADMKTVAQGLFGIDDRRWSAFGYSTGGWCAAELAIRHQDQYQSAVSLAGYFSPSFSAGINARERKVLSAEYDLVKTLSTRTNNLKLMIIYSRSDKFAYASMNKFVGKANSLLPIKLVEIPRGGHNIAVWKPYVGTGFDWLGANGELVTQPTTK
jgi:S-formylglutathione hydrolase FrmB